MTHRRRGNLAFMRELVTRREMLRDVIGMGALAACNPGSLLANRRSAAPLCVDSHVHVWAQDPRFPFAAGAKVPPGDFSVERLLSLMRANRVDRTVLIQVIHYKWDNRYLHDVLQRYPKLFHGVCRVQSRRPGRAGHSGTPYGAGLSWCAAEPGGGSRLDPWPADGSALEALRGTAGAHDAADPSDTSAGHRAAARCQPRPDGGHRPIARLIAPICCACCSNWRVIRSST